MAIDQLLLERSHPVPLIRFYQWSEPTVSFGYFEKLSDAKRDFPGDELRYVRRWTGGGIVDHREDQTYSLFFPKGHPVEQLRGNGSYAVIITNKTGCVDTSECFSINNVGLGEMVVAKGIHVYPNPALEALNVQSLELQKGSTIAIYNSSGRLVLKDIINAGPNEHITLDISTLKPGLYFLRVDMQVLKFVKE